MKYIALVLLVMLAACSGQVKNSTGHEPQLCYVDGGTGEVVNESASTTPALWCCLDTCSATTSLAPTDDCFTFGKVTGDSCCLQHCTQYVDPSDASMPVKPATACAAYGEAPKVTTIRTPTNAGSPFPTCVELDQRSSLGQDQYCCFGPEFDAWYAQQ